MLTLTAKVINTFQTPVGKTKEGQEYGGGDKVQLEVHEVLKNNQTRVKLLTLPTRRVQDFEVNIGRDIEVPVGVFVSGKDLLFYIPDNARVKVLHDTITSKKTPQI